MGRRLAREEIFKYIFEADINNETLKEDSDFYINREEAESFRKEELDYIKTSIEGIRDNIEIIDETIKQNMEIWHLDRLGIVERVLLKYAVYELLFTDIGKEIIVNEAIELAKKYGEEKSSEFVNGVLARIIKNI